MRTFYCKGWPAEESHEGELVIDLDKVSAYHIRRDHTIAASSPSFVKVWIGSQEFWIDGKDTQRFLEAIKRE